MAKMTSLNSLIRPHQIDKDHRRNSDLQHAKTRPHPRRHHLQPKRIQYSSLPTFADIDDDLIENGNYNCETQFGDNYGAPPPQPRKLAAVAIRDGHKSYQRDEPVLKGFNMTVEYGTIYSLLGASGCGKTTVLSCIVGARRLNKGDVFVYGISPGTSASKAGKCLVPGSALGYMPQENSLYNEFSIAETLSYYGILYGKNRKQIKESLTKLVELLELPEESRIVGTLSGGQKRRMSLAVTLFHQPDLLVLDEPTVGLDPLLVKKIWDHLVELVKSQRVTVIVTTHYIQEADHSHTVGVMRNGALLAEKSPRALKLQFATGSLDTAVLRLCKQADSRYPAFLDSVLTMSEVGGQRSNREIEYHNQDNFRLLTVSKPDSGGFHEFSGRIEALCQKNILFFLRNFLFLLFVVFVPGMIVFLVSSNVQHLPYNLNLGVVNLELERLSVTSGFNSTEEMCHDILHDLDLDLARRKSRSPLCSFENLSCRYLQSVDPEKVILKYFHSEDEALENVRQGHALGYMVFPLEFSTYLARRISSVAGGVNISDELMDRSSIKVRLDVTPYYNSQVLQSYLYGALEHFQVTMMQKCGQSKEKVSSPLEFGNPLYGSKDGSLLGFIATGMSLGLIFFFPIITSSIRFIGEKKSGTLERSMVAGARIWEILIAQSLTDMILLAFQSAFIYRVVMVEAFGLPNLGNGWYCVALCYLMGLVGMSLGFFVGLLCTEEIQAALIAMVTFFPTAVFSGICNPIEGLPEVLQVLSLGLPTTLSITALRGIMLRGWEFRHPEVWPGFVVPLIYIGALWTLTILLQRWRLRN